VKRRKTGEEKQIIEVNGVKMEVDLRYEKRVDHFKVGDRVRILKKKSSYLSCEVLSGVIVGFEPFKDLPTIIVATIENRYSESKLDFHYINSENDSVEMVPALDDFIPLEKEHIVAKFNKEIEDAQNKIGELERKKRYFLNNFKMYFEDVVETAERA
jgi:hypothetical protein